MVINLKKLLYISLMAILLMTGLGAIVKAVMPPAVTEPKQVAQSPSAPETVRANLPGQVPARDKFFAEYRMDRERIRGKQIEMLREIMNQSGSEREARQAASLRLVEISADMEREMKAEALIKSKGYDDCVVIIQPENTTVVVAVASLRLDQEKEIIGLVSRITKTREDQIVIIAREASKS